MDNKKRPYLRMLILLATICFVCTMQSKAQTESLNDQNYARVIERYGSSDPASVNLNALYQLARAYEETMNYAEALAAYRECFERRPDEVSLLNDLARVCSKSGMTREAVGYLKQAVDKQEDDHYLRYKLAEANYAAGEYGETSELCVDLLERGYNQPHVWLLMGQACQAMGLAEAALSQYWEACRQQPYNRTSALKYLNLFLNQRESDPIAMLEAVVVCDSALVYNPKDVDIRFAKAILYYRMSNFKRADDIFSEMLIEGDTLPSVARYGGMARVQVNRNFDALSLLMKAYERDSTDYLVLMSLANANLSLTRYEQAKSFLDRAEETLKHEDRHFAIETTRGQLYFNSQQWGEAMLHYYKAYQQYNKNDLGVLVSAYYASMRKQPQLNEDSLFLLYTLVNRSLESGIPLPTKRYFAAELEKYLEGAFFGNQETLPMRSPTGSRSTATMEKLREMVKSITN